MRLDLPDQADPALHLVRHGQSTWNLDGRLQGQADEPELTDVGRDQARQAADRLIGIGAVRLLTSDLRRAADTAEIIGGAIGLAPVRTTLLREVHYGALQGLPSGQAAAEWERLVRAAVDEFGDPLPAAEVRMPGGESTRDVLARVEALLATPWITEAAGDVILVSHGDTIRILLSHLLGDDPDSPTWREVGNGEVQSVYRDRTGRVRLVSSGSIRTDTPDRE